MAPNSTTAHHHLADWDPEDVAAWEAGNNVIARRNLIWSTVAEHVGFSIWTIWSVLMLFMPQSLYGITPGDKLLLGAVATLVGGCTRIPYTIGTARFGGRNWAVFSSLVLMVPTIGALLLVLHPGRPLWMYVVCAALTGLGGGNYSASLANVDTFYPQRLKGVALGLCGGIGNLGVAAIQLVGLLVLAAVGNSKPYLVCAIYLVLLSIVGVGAALGMNSLDHNIEASHVRSILSVPDSWAISALYSAAFGSFIGFAFAFVQVLHQAFQDSGQSPAQASLYAARIAFLGPLLGALARIYGGRAADRHGGGRVTFAVFIGMIAAAGILVITGTLSDHTPGPVTTANIVAYIVGFIALFVLSGVGNGSVLKMIPSIFDEHSRRLALSAAERRAWAQSHSGALIGFATAVGALGGVGINLALRQSYASTGTETPAFWAFLGTYFVAAALTWTMYLRYHPAPPAEAEAPTPGPPALSNTGAIAR